MAPPDDTPRNEDESSEIVNPVLEDEEKKEQEEAAAAAAKTKSSSSTLFERLGGTAAVRSVVDDFYQRCLDDPMLSNFFDSSKLTALKNHQLRFLRLAFTSSIPKDMDVASMLLQKHKVLFEERGLNASHFDKVCLHLVASLDSAGASSDLIQEAAGIVVPLRAVFEKGAQLYGSNSVGGEEEKAETASDEESEPDATSQQHDQYGSHAVLHSSTSNKDGETRPATLSDRLGGNDALRATVAGLYQRILQDDELSSFFQDVNMTALKLHQLEFLKVAFGQIPDNLDVAGLIMSKHAQLFEAGLNETHFDRVANHLAATLVDLGVSQELIDEVVSVVGPLRAVFEEGAQRALERTQ